MASSAGFRFKKFEWDPDGYNAFKSSTGVRSMLEERARAIRSRAESLSGAQYTTDVEQSALYERPYAVVRTDSLDAMRDNAANNTLLKSIDAGRL